MTILHPSGETLRCDLVEAPLLFEKAFRAKEAFVMSFMEKVREATGTEVANRIRQNCFCEWADPKPTRSRDRGD